MENVEKCTVAMLGGPCSQHVTGNTSRLNQPQSAIMHIITTWRGITCRIAVTIEGVENAYLPGNVHFQYQPTGTYGN